MALDGKPVEMITLLVLCMTIWMQMALAVYGDQFVYVPSQWETVLQCNVVPHWLGAYTKWSQCICIGLLAKGEISLVSIYLIKFSNFQICIFVSTYHHFTSIGFPIIKVNLIFTVPTPIPGIIVVFFLQTKDDDGLVQLLQSCLVLFLSHDDVIKWKHFPRYWPFVRGIHRSPVKSQHKGQWRGALMFSLICTWIKGWVNNGEAGDLRRYRAHFDTTVMCKPYILSLINLTHFIISHSMLLIMHREWYRYIIHSIRINVIPEPCLHSEVNSQSIFA